MRSNKFQMSSNGQNSKLQAFLGHWISRILNLLGSQDFGFGIWFRISFFSLFLSLILPMTGLGQTPMKVGALVPYSGRWGDSGRECAKGMLDATRWINQREGILGKKLDLTLIDDTSQTAEVIAAYRKLNELDRILTLYVYATETVLALAPHFHHDKIPTLTSSLPSQYAKATQYPYIFSINPTPLDLAKIAMHFISEKSGIKGRKPKVIFIGSSDHFGRHFLDEAKGYAKTLGIEIGPDIWITDLSTPGDMTAQQIRSVLPMIASSHPDFAYLSLTSKEISSFLQEIKKIDLKTKWICNRRAFDENLIPFEGTFGVQPISPFGEEVPGMAPIKEAHQRWHPYDSHTLSYVEGWVTMQIISEALKRSRPDQWYSREKVKDSFESFKDFVTGGLTPPITITSKDHRPSVESRIFLVKDGKLLRHTGFISIGR